MGIYHSRDLGNEAREVRGTAGCAEPLLASSVGHVEVFVAVRLERVYVEEEVAFEVNACKHIVVERYFGNIYIFCVARHQEHAVVEKHVPHGRAGLVVGVSVGKHIVGAESLDVAHCAQSSGDVHLLVHNVVPYCFEGWNKCGVAGNGCNVGHSRVKIGGANCVSYSCSLLAHWHMLLGVVRRSCVFTIGLEAHSANVYEAFRHVQVKGVACNAVHFYKCKLYLFVSRCLIYRLSVVVGGVALEENFIYMAGALLGNVQPFALACCLVIGYCALVHVPHIVKLVAEEYVGVGPVACAPFVGGVAHPLGNLMILVQIAVVGLCIGNNVDNFVHASFEILVFLELQQIGCSLHHFEKVGRYVEGEGNKLLLLFAFSVCGRAAQVFHCTLGLLQGKRHKRFFLYLQTRQPEIVVQCYLLERYRVECFVHFCDVAAACCKRSGYE